MNHELRSQNVLFIDTSSNDEAVVGLKIGGKEHNKTKSYDKNRSQVVLPVIQELLRDHDLTLRDIAAIKVNVGPGSFTGLRVGVAIANTLGMFLHIPVNGHKPGKLVDPEYT